MNRVAVITGAGRGIGAAAALRLAADGFDVCVNYLNDTESAESIVAQAQALGVRALAVQADISIEAEVERLFQCVDTELGPLQALVNNAGVLDKQSRLVDMSADRINKILATNVTGTFMCCKQAVLRMSALHGGVGGVIVNVSSAAARLGAAGEYIDYASSKGAVDTLTIGLANEVAAEGIRVNGVRPAFIYTDMHAAGGEAGRVDRVKAGIPLQRGGEPTEVAAAIAWLVSEESSYTTGSLIDVSGGR